MSNWKTRHNAAMAAPSTPEEKRMVRVMGTVRLLADDMQDDGYGIPEVLIPAIRAARNLLNYELGALDAGTLDRELYAIAEASGWDLDLDCWAVDTEDTDTDGIDWN